MRIFVDADACPVKDIVAEIGKEYKIPVFMVFSLSHYGTFFEGIESIIVDNAPQAVDMAIINRAKKNDVVITQDYGLAAVVMKKGCIVLHHTGKIYSENKIDELLFRRHLASKIRRSGGKVGGPKAFTREDKEKFRKVLLKVVMNYRQE